MADQFEADRDIAFFRSMIEGPAVGLAAHMADRPYLRTVDEARDDLAHMLIVLEDVKAGRVVSHAQISADIAARRRGGAVSMCKPPNSGHHLVERRAARLR